MDKGQRYLRWLSYVVIISLFSGVMLTTLGKALWLVLQHLW
ncbi:hypothetical protein [Shewanella sp. AS16]|nr:hypothetical protein [Shewanella sp. AS16]